jgi:hypothetical protein
MIEAPKTIPIRNPEVIRIANEAVNASKARDHVEAIENIVLLSRQSAVNSAISESEQEQPVAATAGAT